MQSRSRHVWVWFVYSVGITILSLVAQPLVPQFGNCRFISELPAWLGSKFIEHQASSQVSVVSNNRLSSYVHDLYSLEGRQYDPFPPLYLLFLVKPAFFIALFIALISAAHLSFIMRDNVCRRETALLCHPSLANRLLSLYLAAARIFFYMKDTNSKLIIGFFSK